MVSERVPSLVLPERGAVLLWEKEILTGLALSCVGVSRSSKLKICNHFKPSWGNGQVVSTTVLFVSENSDVFHPE
jgi:hypothetical protein